MPAFCKLGECLGRGSPGAPGLHARENGFAVIASRLVGRIQWIAGPTLLITHETVPSA